MRKVIEGVIFLKRQLRYLFKTGVNQGLISDIKDGYMTIDSMSYLDAERLYFYGLERKNTSYKLKYKIE